MNARLLSCLLALPLFPSLGFAQSAEYLGMHLGTDNLYLRTQPGRRDSYIRSAIVGDTAFAGLTWLIALSCSSPSREALCSPGASQSRSYFSYSYSQIPGYHVETAYRSADGFTVDSTKSLVFERDTTYTERRDSVRQVSVSISYLPQCQVGELGFHDCLRTLRYTDSTRTEALYAKGIGLLRNEAVHRSSSGDSTIYFVQAILSTQGTLQAVRRPQTAPAPRERLHAIDGRIRPHQVFAPAPRF